MIASTDYSTAWRNEHTITVAFTNDAGIAEISYVGNHYTPDPEGGEYKPASTLLAEAFQVQTRLTVGINGYPPMTGTSPLPTQLTTNNLDFPGRIDNAGDKETFTW